MWRQVFATDNRNRSYHSRPSLRLFQHVRRRLRDAGEKQAGQAARTFDRRPVFSDHGATHTRMWPCFRVPILPFDILFDAFSIRFLAPTTLNLA